MLLIPIVLCAVVMAAAVIWKHFFAGSLIIKSLLNLGGLLALASIIVAATVYLQNTRQPTFGIAVENAQWYQDPPSDLSRAQIPSKIWAELLVENRKEYRSTIAQIGIDTLYLKDYRHLHLDDELSFYWQLTDSLGHKRFFTVGEDQLRFTWYYGEINEDLSIFELKEKKTIYVMFRFTSLVLLEPQQHITAELCLTDMAKKRIRKTMKVTPAR